MERRKRNPVKTRAQILQAAFAEIYPNGFQGASVNRIIEKSHMTKGAFFHHFPSKQQLGYAVADELLLDIIMNRWIRPLTAYPNPLHGVLRQFRTLIDADEFVSGGCPLFNLSQEMSQIDPTFREKLQSVMSRWIDEMQKLFRKAQADGYIKEDVDTRQLAEFVVMILEGSYAMAKLFDSRKILLSFHGSLKRHLESVGTVRAS